MKTKAIKAKVESDLAQLRAQREYLVEQRCLTQAQLRQLQGQIHQHAEQIAQIDQTIAEWTALIAPEPKPKE